jgi:DsbC/DsbD-like thiol-disulfide interchange protein
MPNRSKFRWLCLLLVSSGWLISSPARSSETPGDKNVKVELVSEEDAVVSGNEIWLGIRFELQEGWHTYWINPGDSGEAPRISWRLPGGFKAGEIQWPYPERLATPGFADYGYQHEALLIVPVRPAKELKEGQSVMIAALVHYLICENVCIPGQKQLELSLPVKSRAAGSAARELFQTTRSRLPRPVPRDWKISVISAGDEFLLDLKRRQLAKAPQFFPLEAEQVENAAPQPKTPIPGGIRLHLKKSKHLLRPVPRLKGVIVVAPGRAYLLDVPVSQQLKKVRTE